MSWKVLEKQRSVLKDTSRTLEGKSVVTQEYLKEKPLSIKNTKGKSVFSKNDSRKIGCFESFFRNFLSVLCYLKLNLAATYVNRTSLGLPQNQIDPRLKLEASLLEVSVNYNKNCINTRKRY